MAMEVVARQQYEEAQSSQQAARASSAQLLRVEEHARALADTALQHRQQHEVWLQQQQEQQHQTLGVLSGQLRQEEQTVGQLRQALQHLESVTGQATQAAQGRMQQVLGQFELEWERQRSEDRQWQQELALRTQQVCRLEAQAAALTAKAVADRPSAQRAEYH
ncbi:MAG: hypothetical protein GY772_16440, partial [bacterium]|nr:hypothetical protein [bacterium]